MKREIKAGDFFHEIEPKTTTEDLEAARLSEEEAGTELSRLFAELAQNSKKRERAQREDFFEGCGAATDGGCMGILCDCSGLCRCAVR